MRGKIFIISSPSGGGKTTITNNVIDNLNGLVNIERVITYTSRPKRNYEVNGKDYFFISKNEFINKKKNNFFIETTVYNGELYGSSKEIIDDLNQGKSYIIVTDREGVKSYTKHIENIITIWIIPPDIETLKKRLENRGTESDKQIKARVDLAKKEIKWENNNKRFEYHILNKNVDDAVLEVCSIVKKELLCSC